MANALLQNAVKSLVIETEWLPPIVIADPFGDVPPGQQAASAVIGGILKPRITIESGLTSAPIVSAPWGQPAENWPLLKVILIALGALGVVTVVVPAIARRLPRGRLSPVPSP